LLDFDQAYNHCNSLNGDTLQDDPDAGMLKKWENEDGDTSYAFMLPIPKNDVIHRQVYRDYQTKTTFGGSSNCAIEHLFYGAVNQDTYFKTEPSPGGEQVKFDGDKTSFSKEVVPSLPPEAFEVFRPMFDFIISKCEIT